MLMPKSNGVASPAAASCGKNAVAAVYPYSCAPIPEAFQQMTMPMNGHYPVTSKFFNLQCDSKMLRFYPQGFLAIFPQRQSGLVLVWLSVWCKAQTCIRRS